MFKSSRENLISKCKWSYFIYNSLAYSLAGLNYMHGCRTLQRYRQVSRFGLCGSVVICIVSSPQKYSSVVVSGPVGRHSHGACLLMSQPHPQLLVTGGVGNGGDLKDSWVVEVHIADGTAVCREVSVILLHPDTRPGTGVTSSGRPMCAHAHCMHVCLHAQ